MQDLNINQIEEIKTYKSRLLRRILELENRLTNCRHWTSGEKEIFKTQVRIAKTKLRELEAHIQ